MKNETNLFKRIRNIIVGNTLPKNEDLWIDTSNGEKNAVLKYKGNPLVGGGSGSGGGSGCDCSGGIPYNQMPEVVTFREPTNEDSAKFNLSSSEGLYRVADLQNGIIPEKFYIAIEEEDPFLGTSTLYLRCDLSSTVKIDNSIKSALYITFDSNEEKTVSIDKVMKILWAVGNLSGISISNDGTLMAFTTIQLG